MRVAKSNDAVAMLDRILLEGMKPDFWQIHELGLDVRYLEKIVDKVKDRLWELPEYRPLKSFTHSGRSEEDQQRFAEASVADTPCMRIGYDRRGDYSGRSYFEPLLSVYPKDNSSGHSSKMDIELFVTARAEWILYDGRNITDADSFTICRSVEELRTHLDGLTNDTHQLSPSMHAVLTHIANCLIFILRKEVDRLQKSIAHHEATLTECTVLQDRLNVK